MREIYIYGYETEIKGQLFSGYGICSPEYEKIAFSNILNTQEDLGSELEKKIAEYPGSILISGIPDIPYVGEGFVFDHGSGSSTSWSPKRGENIDLYLNTIDFSLLRRLHITDAAGTREYRVLYNTEWHPNIQKLLIQGNRNISPK